MQTSTKILLAVAVISTLGLGGLAKTVYGKQSQPAVVVTPQNSAANQKPEVSNSKQSQPTVVVTPQNSAASQKPEVSDGDGEENDAKEKPEANEGPNDRDGGVKEDAH
jgi:hypothetical protein